MRIWDNYLFYGHTMCGAGAAVPGALASPTGGAGLNPNEGQTLPLEAGMLIALEPKVILPGQGVLGIENTLLVTKTGLESLTLYPDTITVVL